MAEDKKIESKIKGIKPLCTYCSAVVLGFRDKSSWDLYVDSGLCQECIDEIDGPTDYDDSLEVGMDLGTADAFSFAEEPEYTGKY